MHLIPNPPLDFLISFVGFSCSSSRALIWFWLLPLTGSHVRTDVDPRSTTFIHPILFLLCCHYSCSDLHCFFLAGILVSAARLIFTKSNSNHITLQLKSLQVVYSCLLNCFLILSFKAQPHPTAFFYKLIKVNLWHLVGAQ